MSTPSTPARDSDKADMTQASIEVLQKSQQKVAERRSERTKALEQLTKDTNEAINANLAVYTRRAEEDDRKDEEEFQALVDYSTKIVELQQFRVFTPIHTPVSTPGSTPSSSRCTTPVPPAFLHETPAKAAATMATLKTIEEDDDDSVGESKIPSGGEDLAVKDPVVKRLKMTEVRQELMVGVFDGSKVSWHPIPLIDGAVIIKVMQVGDCTLALLQGGTLWALSYFQDGLFFGHTLKKINFLLDLPGGTATGTEFFVDIQASALGEHAVAITNIGNVYKTKYKGKGKFEPFVFVDTGKAAMACVGMLNSGEIFGFAATNLKDPKTESTLQFIPPRAETEIPKGAFLPKLRLHAKVASGTNRCLTMAFDKNKKALAYQIIPNKVKLLEFGRISKFKKNGEVADIAANQTHTYVLKTEGHVLASEDGMTWMGSSADDEYLLSKIVAGDGFVMGTSKVDPARMVLMIHGKLAGTTQVMSVDLSIRIVNIVDINASGKFVCFVANVETDTKRVAAKTTQQADDDSTAG